MTEDEKTISFNNDYKREIINYVYPKKEKEPLGGGATFLTILILLSSILFQYIPLIVIVYCIILDIINQVASLITMFFLGIYLIINYQYSNFGSGAQIYIRTVLQMLTQCTWIFFSLPIVTFLFTIVIKLVLGFFKAIFNKFSSEELDKVRDSTLGWWDLDEKYLDNLKKQRNYTEDTYQSMLINTKLQILEKRQKRLFIQKIVVIIFSVLAILYLLTAVALSILQIGVKYILIVGIIAYIILPAIGITDVILRSWKLVIGVHRFKRKNKIKSYDQIAEKIKNGEKLQHVFVLDLSFPTTWLLRKALHQQVLNVIYPEDLMTMSFFADMIHEHIAYIRSMPKITFPAYIFGMLTKTALLIIDAIVPPEMDSYWPYSFATIILYLAIGPLTYIAANYCSSWMFLFWKKTDYNVKRELVKPINEAYNTYIHFRTFTRINLLWNLSAPKINEIVDNAKAVSQGKFLGNTDNVDIKDVFEALEDKEFIPYEKGVEIFNEKGEKDNDQKDEDTAFHPPKVTISNRRISSVDDMGQYQNMTDIADKEDETKAQEKKKEEEKIQFSDFLSGHTMIRTASIAMQIIYCLVMLVVVIAGICIIVWRIPIQRIGGSKIAIPSILHRGYYTDPPMSQPYCGTGSNGLTITELAALPQLAYFSDSAVPSDVREYNTELIMDLAFRKIRSQGYEVECIHNTVVPHVKCIVSKDEEYQYTIIIPAGMIDRRDWAYLLEMILQEYTSLLISSLIPFYDPIIGLFDTSIYNIQEWIQGLTGIRSISAQRAKQLKNTVANMNGTHNIAVGQGTGGYFAKYLGYTLRTNFSAYSLDSLSFMANALKTHVNENLTETPVNIFNIYSSSSIYGRAEADLPFNYKRTAYDFGSLKSLVRPPNATNAFCKTVADCSTEQSFIDFCEATIGHESLVEEMERSGRSFVEF